MITKTYTGKDNDIHRQLDEVISKQFERKKEVTVTFTAANVEALADVGFLADRYVPTSLNADIRHWLVSSDNRYMHFMASGAGTMKALVYKAV